MPAFRPWAQANGRLLAADDFHESGDMRWLSPVSPIMRSRCVAMERDILEKRRHTLQMARSEVCLHRASSADLADLRAVPGAQGERVGLSSAPVTASEDSFAPALERCGAAGAPQRGVRGGKWGQVSTKLDCSRHDRQARPPARPVLRGCGSQGGVGGMLDPQAARIVFVGWAGAEMLCTEPRNDGLHRAPSC